jgi:F-type H+-transporting ATPase subunit delta
MLVALGAAACLLWAPAFVAPRQAAQAPRASRTLMRADLSGLAPGGPLVAYTDALIEAAAKQGETVPVTKDMMKVKKMLKDEAFLEELSLVVNALGTTEVMKAQGMVKLLSPLESKTVPKFIVFLAKKARLVALAPLAEEFVNTLYSTQSIAPVRVVSAQRLTEAQIGDIKNKMKAKTGASDIKLVQEVDAGLLGGFRVEWGFTDPEGLGTPTEGVDLSLKSFLQKAALNQGVVTQL